MKVVKLKWLMAVCLSVTMIYAHGGRTDKYGGHTNRSTGEYHYHNGGYTTKDYTSSSKYVLSMFQNKKFKGLGDTFDTKSECMSERYRLWKQNRDKGWTYGCRKF